MRAVIVVDLGFGDAGKGLLTDFLTRHHQAGLVVRYNGGAQAGHNVLTPDGRHHTFAQFGAGTFAPGVKTYLSRHVVIHPGALLVEGDLLAGKGAPDAFARLRVSADALVITPFHQAANRMREIVRGAGRHGSCGVGVGEAVEDALADPETRLSAGDLSRPGDLRRKLRAIREQKRTQMAELCRERPLLAALAREWTVFEREDVNEAWIASIARINTLGLVVPDDLLARWLNETETVIFEGAQGVLLDAEAGFHPHTTWSNCTTANAHNLIAEMAPGSPITQIGVLRAHAVRHGPGPLPTETEALKAVVAEHNRRNDWQGAVRYGWFDAVLARYALNVTGPLDALAVTHMDMLTRLKEWPYCPGYRIGGGFAGGAVEPAQSNGLLTGFRTRPSATPAQRAEFTQALSSVAPVIEACAADEQRVLQQIAALLGRPVGLISRGPGAGDVQILDW